MKNFVSVRVLGVVLISAALGGFAVWLVAQAESPVFIFIQQAAGRKDIVRVSETAPSRHDDRKTERIFIDKPAEVEPAQPSPSREVENDSPPSDAQSFAQAPEAPALARSIILQNNLYAPINQQAAQVPVAVNQSGSRIDDALSFALEAADPYVKEGFTIREDYWGGALPVKQQKAIVHQLFKGNEYWFWMGTAAENTKIAVHIYDSEGTLSEAQVWQKGKTAAVRAVPQSTGSYYLIVEIEQSPQERTDWALAYGYR